MKKIMSVVAGTAALLAFSASVSAAGLADQFNLCVNKFANPKLEATVMLDCVAADGKLTACKVIENSSNVAGFDKAAMCVAEVLPIGSKTGPIKVPVKFTPAS